MIKMSFKVCVTLPTCEPDEMFTWLEPSLEVIKDLKDTLQFAIVFQPPYTKIQIERVINKLESLGFEYKYEYKNYKVVKPYTPLIKMRNDCAMMFPDADAYMLLDDDMSFVDEEATALLSQIIQDLEYDDSLAVAAINSYESFFENSFATNSGLFYRGGKHYGFKGLMPENLLDFKNIKTKIPYEGENVLELFGGFQDKFCAMVRLATGEKAKQYVTKKIRHIENRKIRGAQGHGWEEAKYEQGSISQFIIKYFNKYFLDTGSMGLFDSEEMVKVHPAYYFMHGYSIFGYEHEMDAYTIDELFKHMPMPGVFIH